MRRASWYRPVVGALAFSWVLCSCIKQAAPPADAKSTVSAASKVPQFKGTVGQFDAGASFVDFLEKNASSTVQLNITIPDGQFNGSNEAGNVFFIIFDDCDNQADSEAPSAGPCSGTEVNIGNSDSGSLMTHQNGAWHLAGQFQVGDESGPLQGLMSIDLEADGHP